MALKKKHSELKDAFLTSLEERLDFEASSAAFQQAISQKKSTQGAKKAAAAPAKKKKAAAAAPPAATASAAAEPVVPVPTIRPGGKRRIVPTEKAMSSLLANTVS